MELGALNCSPVDPKCERCALLRDCVAGNSADPSALPEFPPGRATIAETHSAALIRDRAGRFLIARRPLHGLWGGLWEFPRVVCESGETPAEGAARAAREVVGLEVEIGAKVGRVKHAVTHHRITLYGFDARPRDPNPIPQTVGCAAFRWEAPDALADHAFSSPQVLLREALHTYLHREVHGDLQPSLGFDE
jgi:A/G-specific adenine glycosylase